MERAKFLAMQEQLSIQRVRESEEIAKRTLEEQSRHEKARLEYRDQLERKRTSDQIVAQRQLNDEERKKTEQSLLRQEEIRRRTLDHESELREKAELAKIKAEYLGRILQERENHDLIIENKKLDAKEYRETFLEGLILNNTLH
jgi:ATPase family AAA domain-containing protein 3A/B